MPRTIKELAQEAIQIQDASNLRGLSKGYAESMEELAKLLDTEKQFGALARHPISQMWACKLYDLSGMGISDIERFGKAYDACKKLAGQE